MIPAACDHAAGIPAIRASGAVRPPLMSPTRTAPSCRSATPSTGPPQHVARTAAPRARATDRRRNASKRQPARLHIPDNQLAVEDQAARQPLRGSSDETGKTGPGPGTAPGLHRARPSGPAPVNQQRPKPIGLLFVRDRDVRARGRASEIVSAACAGIGSTGGRNDTPGPPPAPTPTAQPAP